MQNMAKKHHYLLMCHLKIDEHPEKNPVVGHNKKSAGGSEGAFR